MSDQDAQKHLDKWFTKIISKGNTDVYCYDILASKAPRKIIAELGPNWSRWDSIGWLHLQYTPAIKEANSNAR